jgi:hypothetical protein
MTYVQNYNSQQANILKCSIKLTSGGLIESKIVSAYKALKNSTVTNKTAAYMAVLSLDNPQTTGYTKAVEADGYCKQTGVTGLVYISSVILAGTYMNKVIADLTGSAVNVTDDPSAINSAVTTMLNACTSNPPDSNCTSDLSTLGGTVTTIASSYCTSTSADQSVCSNVNSAVTAAGGDSTQVGQAVFCYLQNKTYNTTTHVCN